ncbi:MAG: hypothetical protein ACPG31_13740 [Planctomycetota bacterium]
MNPPLFAAAVLFFGPILVLLAGRYGLLLVSLSALTGLLLGNSYCVRAWAMVFVASFGLAMLGLGDRNQGRGIAVWAGLCTIPLWAPATPFWWRLWPGLGLQGGHWDALSDGWLYRHWGSGAAMPAPSYAWILITYLVIAALLRCSVGLSPILKGRAPSTSSTNET